MDAARSSRGWVVIGAAITLALAACAQGGRSEYSDAADSGKAAPATRLDTSLTRDRPDSTTGGPDRTGKPGVAGDTLSTRGRPAGTGVRPDSTKKRP